MRKIKNNDIAALAREHDVTIAKSHARNAKQRRYGRNTGGYPYESEAMAIEKEDIGKAREIARSHGVFTEYTPTGEPIITSRSHQIAHMRAFGFYERNGTSSPINR